MSEINTPTLNEVKMGRQNKMPTRSQKPRKNIGVKIVLIVIMLPLMVVISVIVANLVHKKGGNNLPTSASVENGLSAYELAVQLGYEGSMQEWLHSLTGKSAYEIAVDNGYSGTEQEWASALEASANRQGETIKTVSFSSKGELLITLSDNTVLNLGVAVGADGKNGLNGKDGINGVNGVDGKDGQDGKDGIDGTNGKDGTNGINGADGKDGISIKSANINADGQLVMNFSDGSSVNLDKVVGVNGTDGVSISKSEINADGGLVLTYSNGQSANVGNVIGAPGKDGMNGTNGKDGKDGTNGIDGINGADGKDGISITNSAINASGELVLTYSDGTTSNLGVVVGMNGKDGQNGTDGKDGQNGANGADGISVTNAEINSDGELVLTYSNGQRSNLGNVIGATGKDGKDGIDGINGTDGKDGRDGVDGKDGIDGAKGEKGDAGEKGADGVNGQDGKDGVGINNITVNENGELEITLTSGTTMNLGTVKGADGVNGKDGINGTDGKDGENGINGVDGQDGIGISETAVNDYGELVITYSDGNSVNLGKVVGKDGTDGINGTNGIDGADGQDGIGITDVNINTDNELVLTFSDLSSINLGCIVGKDGKDGLNGADGVNGQDGKDGADGVGIANVTISQEGALTVTLTNRTLLNLGNIKGADGIGISKSEINADGELLLTYTSGRTVTLGNVVGANGTDGIDGTNGTDGRDGVGIKSVTLSADGYLSILMTDNSVTNLGNVKGEKGDKGDKGDPGVDGKDGKDGRGIAKTELVNGELIITYTDGTSDNLGVIGSGISPDVPDMSMYVFTLLDDDTYAIAAADSFNLSVADIPETYNGKKVTQIAENGFESLSVLTEVVLTENIIKVGSHAFRNSGVTTINIPFSLQNIGSYAFAGCPLKNVDVRGTPTWWVDTIGSFPDNTSGYRPITSYATALTKTYTYQEPYTLNYAYKYYYQHDWKRQ